MERGGVWEQPRGTKPKTRNTRVLAAFGGGEHIHTLTVRDVISPDGKKRKYDVSKTRGLGRNVDESRGFDDRFTTARGRCGSNSAPGSESKKCGEFRNCRVFVRLNGSAI